MAEDEEFEVESIIQARVEKKRGRGNHVIWKYLVKWKGYSKESNTWEPQESFEGGSEHMISKFWERAHSGDRNVNNLSLFKAGEEFYPVGPPRKKAKRKATDSEDRPPASLGPVTEISQIPSSAKSGKRRRYSQVSQEEEPPTKRTRGRSFEVEKSTAHSSTSQSSGAATGSKAYPTSALINISRKQSGSDVADSEDEVAKDYLPEAEPADTKTSEDGLDLQGEPNNVFGSQIIQQDRGNDEDLFDDLQYPPQAETPDISARRHSASAASLPQIPSHRARAANPLVKLADDPNFKGMGGAISVKARLLRQNSPAASGSETQTRSKPKATGSSKGLQSRKSSLLVFQKGGLKTLKGKYSAEATVKDGMLENRDGNSNTGRMQGEEDNGMKDDIPGLSNASDSMVQATPPPSGQELLEIAGLNADAEALPDFDDDTPMLEEPVFQNSSASQSLAHAKNNLFPMISTVTTNVVVPPLWRRPTIFGPLSLGAPNSPLPDPAVEIPLTETRPTFYLNLSSSVSIPTTLKDVSQSSSCTPSLEMAVAQSLNGPPGKFYRDQSALALLDCLTTGGSAARLVVDSIADEDQKSHFERFRARLRSGELFVAMAGVHLFTFCSSENMLIGQKLNVPHSLLGLSGNVVVSRVNIKDYSAYGDAAVQADAGRW